ncbi:ATP-binding protein [Streptomyces adustus]|uniref:ATP-binding protein n=1 Tax=Streptomyces adustus TaxID=1609272 RepID=UPI003719067E
MPTSPTDPATTPRRIEWCFSRHARSVGRARNLFREQAAIWKLPEETTETAVLLLSELMTNAYRHARVPAGRQIRTLCLLQDDRLRISVTDANGTLPTPRETAPEHESGRGLALVAALADGWGAQPRAGGIGKTVWFELCAPCAPDA